MKTVGGGVREIRIRDAAGAFRVIYLATRADAIYALHAFQKKTARTAKRDRAAAGTCAEAMIMERQTFENVWDALEKTPADAANMTLRSDLMIAVCERVNGWNLTQAEAAQRLGMTQPRLNDLLRGRISKFSLDALINIATRSGLTVRLDIRTAA